MTVCMCKYLCIHVSECIIFGSIHTLKIIALCIQKVGTSKEATPSSPNSSLSDSEEQKKEHDEGEVLDQEQPC